MLKAEGLVRLEQKKTALTRLNVAVSKRGKANPQGRSLKPELSKKAVVGEKRKDKGKGKVVSSSEPVSQKPAVGEKRKDKGKGKVVSSSEPVSKKQKKT